MLVSYNRILNMQIIRSRRGSIPVSTSYGNLEDFSEWLWNPWERELYRVKTLSVSSMAPDPSRSWHLQCSVSWKLVTSYPRSVLVYIVVRDTCQNRTVTCWHMLSLAKANGQWCCVEYINSLVILMPHSYSTIKTLRCYNQSVMNSSDVQ